VNKAGDWRPPLVFVLAGCVAFALFAQPATSEPAAYAHARNDAVVPFGGICDTDGVLEELGERWRFPHAAAARRPHRDVRDARELLRLITANITKVWASVEMLGCSDDDHTPQTSPLSIFSAYGLTGKAHETALTTGILESLAGYFHHRSFPTNITIVDRSVNYSNSQRSAPALNGSTIGYLQDQNLNFPAQNASTGLAVASRRFAQMTMDRPHDFCQALELLRIAAQARPAGLPAPPEHRTVPYEARPCTPTTVRDSQILPPSASGL